MSENKATFFFIAENKTKNVAQKYWKIHAKSVKRSAVFCVAFQDSKDSVKKGPETTVYDMFLSNWRGF